MSGDPSLPKRRLVGIAAIVLLLGLSLILTAPWKQGTKVTMVASVAAAEFADGSRFEVLQAVSSTSLVMTGTPQKGWRLVTSSGSSTYGTICMDLKVKQKNGRFESAEVIRETPALILLTRTLDPYGSEIVPDLCYFSSEDKVDKVLRDSEGLFDQFERFPSRATAPKPAICLEVEDGGGGWLPLTGPIAPVDRDGRSFFFAAVFPRNLADLRFRITKAGGSSKEFTMGNPGFQSAPTPGWAVDPKPWKKTLTEVALEVEKIDDLHYANPKLVQPNPKLLVTPLGSQQPKAFRVLSSNVEDCWGNRCILDEFRVLPGVRELRYHITVERSRHYLWKDTEVMMLAEGVWDDTDPKLELIILSDGTDLGLESMDLAPTGTDKKEWKLSYKGEVETARVPARFDMVLFIGDATEATDRFWTGGSTQTTGGGPTSYDMDGDWKGSISDGQKIRVGLLPPILPEHTSFTLPVDPKYTWPKNLKRPLLVP